jgi:molybdate transport system substrate-binding protein
MARFQSVAFFGLLLLAATPSTARAAEIKLLGPFSLRALLPELLPQFEKSSGNKVTVGYATPGAIAKRLVEGEAVDVAIVSPQTRICRSKAGSLRPAAWRLRKSATPFS